MSSWWSLLSSRESAGDIDRDPAARSAVSRNASTLAATAELKSSGKAKRFEGQCKRDDDEKTWSITFEGMTISGTYALECVLGYEGREYPRDKEFTVESQGIHEKNQFGL